MTGPALADAYARCRELNARHGRTFFLATRLLPPVRRPAVHALYGFARWADEIVDSGTSADPAGELDVLERQLADELAGRPTGHPVLAALADTVRRYRIDPALFADFLASMRMDLHTTEYATLAELDRYMRGSAEVIGLQLLPVFGTIAPLSHAEPGAAALGRAFQLTNFLRDVGEDLDRGRVYLPQDVLRVYDVNRELLAWSRRTGKPDERIRRAVRHLTAVAYAAYREAETAVPLLHPVARPCVRTALVLYREILDGIAVADHHVLDKRVVVSNARRLSVALPGLSRSVAARATSGRLRWNRPDAPGRS
ncbi:phytoene/squalene synthase family protein [Actinosynnema sp. NPDC047251]|uniref:Phytoene synthase n=1 Tax=Saccharothrix espanaensis (strain ATCC 51144 / DSM 44229 / JCM 9112 / NBRC 15066 / NRRL 15764) TaxID=1179773 RepID=K0JXL2_SACES|nr:phytoene/squalene synthase family protein [Saccharothrix espanaensis]CCH28973.1 Phytoene synthase [Saccharothrix espanaensis DSM 44229]